MTKSDTTKAFALTEKDGSEQACKTDVWVQEESSVFATVAPPIHPSGGSSSAGSGTRSGGGGKKKKKPKSVNRDGSHRIFFLFTLLPEQSSCEQKFLAILIVGN